MDTKNLLVSALPALAGVTLAWFLNYLSEKARWKREWRKRLIELRIENYAEWMRWMEEELVRYASRTSGGQYQVPLSEKRLQIVESDPVALDLIQEIHASFPAFESSDYKELNALAHSDPEWEWQPFRDKMNELLVHIRQRIS